MEVILFFALIILLFFVIGLTRRKRDQITVQTELARQELRASPAAGPSTPRLTPQERIDALAQLQELRDSGTLTEDEFQNEKRAILASARPTTGASQNPSTVFDDLDEDGVVRELDLRGYRVRRKGAKKWRIDEPMGGTKVCTDFEALVDYARGVAARKWA